MLIKISFLPWQKSSLSLIWFWLSKTCYCRSGVHLKKSVDLDRKRWSQHSSWSHPSSWSSWSQPSSLEWSLIIGEYKNNIYTYNLNWKSTKKSKLIHECDWICKRDKFIVGVHNYENRYNLEHIACMLFLLNAYTESK